MKKLLKQFIVQERVFSQRKLWQILLLREVMEKLERGFSYQIGFENREADSRLVFQIADILFCKLIV
jgi:hypothetical protein